MAKYVVELDEAPNGVIFSSTYSTKKDALKAARRLYKGKPHAIVQVITTIGNTDVQIWVNGREETPEGIARQLYNDDE